MRIPALLGVALAVCAPGSSEELSEAQPVQFVDVAESAGLDFVHDNAASPEKFLIETMGSGAAWLDYDGDGHLDLYLGNSAATEVYEPEKPLRAAMYRNQGDGTFIDVTESTGLATEGLFGMGVAVGDFDNDGDPDLYVVGGRRSILFRNEDGARFTDVTATAGAGNEGKWGSSAAWFDYDSDGWLDLVIANYLIWAPELNIFCGEPKPGYRSYCHPNKFKAELPTLYRNNGDGTFSDQSEKSGLAAKGGNGLGVVCFDYDGDDWMDVFIANDSMENFLFRNLGNGKFEDVSFEAGVAFGENGEIEAGMGTDAADYDRDGLLDLYVTHLDFELDRLYRNLGDGTFEDATFLSKMAYETFHLSGFGTRFIDYDHDGWRDLFVANGHVLDNIQLFHAETRYLEPKLLFRNNHGRMENVTATAGEDLAKPRVSRAVAAADYDNDGDVDILVTNNGQRVELLRNEGGNRRSWLQILLEGTDSNRDGVGAKVKVVAGELTLVDQRKGGMSYQAAHDPRLHFGLGSAEKVDRVEIRWPSGKVDDVADLPVDQTIHVKEGEGLVPSPAGDIRGERVVGGGSGAAKQSP